MAKHSELPSDQAILDLIRSYKFLRRYKIHRPLGQGGMGLVLLGEDRESGDEVAIKVLLGKVSERGLQRFKREAKTLGVLNHPGTVRLRDYGTDPRPYLVMDYVKGRTLKAAVDESLKFHGRVPDLSWTLDLFLQLSKVLSHCHEKGLLHRDIKPANVLLNSEDKAVLVDFGLVKRKAGSDDFIEGFTEKLSKTGEIVGTVSFMSPEQLGGRDFGELGPATDVWSLGATLFYCLTGRLPYDYHNLTDFIAAKLSTDPLRPRKFNSGIELWLEELCLDCLQREPESRPSLAEFQRAVEHRRQDRKSRLWLLVPALLLLSFLSAGLFLLGPGEELGWRKLAAREVWTRSETVEIIGQSTTTDASLIIDGFPVVIDSDGAFRHSYVLRNGENKIAVELMKGGHRLLETLTVVRDDEAPKLRDIAHEIGSYSVVPSQYWQGSIEDLSLSQFEVNGFVQGTRDGQFRVAFSDAPKVHLMNWRAKDKVGFESSGIARVLSNESVAKAFDGLNDRMAWNRLDPSLQDFVATNASLALGAKFEFMACETFQCGTLKHRLAVFRHRATGIRFHLIPGGRFILGAPDLKKELDFCRRTKANYPTQWIYRERAQREVRVLPILVSQTEITVRQWHAVIGGKAPKRGDWPVEGVSFLKAKKWLERVGAGLRLPSEAEWEYFARAGARTRFFWGDEFNKDYAWTRESTNVAHSVLEHKEKTNAFGLLDTLGNVHEWCEDHWHNDYSGGPKDHKARTRSDSTVRVFRGGSYNRHAAKNRVTYRNGMSENESKQSFDMGFRVVVTLPELGK